MSNPLTQLANLGQSIWWDDIRRSYLVSGELKRLVEDGILGLTSNPSIFEKGISSSCDYDDAIQALVNIGKTTEEIYSALTIEDIGAAADVLRPVYQRTNGRDGYVSIEVSPLLANDTAGTITEAKQLFRFINRPNVMIKVPATPAGIPAIRELIGSGINVNATLIFSLEMYEQVMEAYLAGLELLAASGGQLDRVASVASFFVSRVDTLVDKMLDERIACAASQDDKARLRALQGKAAMANAKLAYARFKKVFSQPRFAALKDKGAQVQRPLWASTSTKNKNYRDVMYVEGLIGADTVNTAPPNTIAAFKDHGTVAATLEQDIDQARALMGQLAVVGVNIDAVTQKLLDDGVRTFTDSYRALLKIIQDKRARLLVLGRQAATLGDLAARVSAAIGELDRQQVATRLWSKDATLWKQDEKAQVEIHNRLGWLDSTKAFQARCDELDAFVAEVKAAGFTHALLLGMGGSSMAPELFRSTFGVEPGCLDVRVLDTTDPASILAAEQAIDLPRTLFIVASKSGGTIEVMSFFKYFMDKMRRVKGAAAGENFCAITDPGSSLEKLAAGTGESRFAPPFRRTFLNPPDIGGRYSAISYFGLAPAALLGIDVRQLLGRAVEMAAACAPGASCQQNPGLWLGAVMGAAHAAGRDKLTFALSPQLAAFGYWVEQLVAESTGKEDQGILPIEGEPIGEPSVYGNDRLFVHIKLEGDTTHDRAMQALEAAGQPVITLRLRDRYDLGGEFLRWGIATITASAMMRINPLDQPNVQSAKENTKLVLMEYVDTGCLPETMAILPESFGARVGAFLQRVRPGVYIALMVYAQRTPEHDALLTQIRTLLRDRFHVATTVGYGPRFLHSTGQLHKGGADNGLFVQITTNPAKDVPIPGEKYSFGVLIAAQALGDMQALQTRGRQAIRLYIPGQVKKGLEQLAHVLAEE